MVDSAQKYLYARLASNMITPDIAMDTTDQDTPLFSIGTVARMLGVSVQTIRMYESEGLVLAEKSPGGQRLYSQSDLERLRCIRHALTVQKMSIAGIRKMQSLVPCWHIVRCSEKERETCPAFREHDRGCWTYSHTTNACAERICRDCDTYKKSTDCSSIKDIIRSYATSSTSVEPTS